jgi:hypothetical protein
MKKLLVLSLGLALLMGLGVGGAWADNLIVFPDTTLIQSYSAGATPQPYDSTNLNDSQYVKTDGSGGTWYDYIGSAYQTYGATYDPTTQKLYLYTNIAGADFSEDLGGGKSATVADLFLNFGWSANTFDTAVIMSGSNQSKSAGWVWTGFTPVTSIAQMAGAGSNWIIGGKYDFDNPQSVPVLTNGEGTAYPAIDVWWTKGTYSVAGLELPASDIWQVEVDLGDYSGFNPDQFSFLWGTGTCANDTITGSYAATPIPGGLLLLGAGLLRLAGYGRRKRSQAS